MLLTFGGRRSAPSSLIFSLGWSGMFSLVVLLIFFQKPIKSEGRQVRLPCAVVLPACKGGSGLFLFV